MKDYNIFLEDYGEYNATKTFIEKMKCIEG
jgi:hypothetical protein